MANPVASLDYADRRSGFARNGLLMLRDFDAGVILTLGPTLVDGDYYLLTSTLEALGITGVCPPSGMPGIPITFGNPDDTITDSKLPQILVSREGIEEAMNRWHPGSDQYRCPARGARPVSVSLPYKPTVEGWDSYESRPQAVPYDITYSIQVQARNRGGVGVSGPRNQAGAIWHYVMSVYQPYCFVLVTDSIGDQRSFAAFATGISTEDDTIDVTKRVIGFRMSLRVEAKLDLNPARTDKAVTNAPTYSSEINDG